MDFSQRIVTSMPLTELWNDQGRLDASRVDYVDEADIIPLLREGRSFVIANVGLPLQWISAADRFEFWKTEVKPRLVARDVDRFYLDGYPGGYCYVAAAWRGVSCATVIVLEKHH